MDYSTSEIKAQAETKEAKTQGTKEEITSERLTLEGLTNIVILLTTMKSTKAFSIYANNFVSKKNCRLSGKAPLFSQTFWKRDEKSMF